VVVAARLNTEVGIGGVGCNLVRFRLVWYERSLNVEEHVRNRRESPRHARTIEEIPTVIPSQCLTRIHTPGEQKPTLRYAKAVQLGRGEFGEVHKAVEVDGGRYVSMKSTKKPAMGFPIHQWRFKARAASSPNSVLGQAPFR
jgi:hypothetical protein